jgi:hypothetical protein
MLARTLIAIAVTLAFASAATIQSNRGSHAPHLRLQKRDAVESIEPGHSGISATNAVMKPSDDEKWAIAPSMPPPMMPSYPIDPRSMMGWRHFGHGKGRVNGGTRTSSKYYGCGMDLTFTQDSDTCGTGSRKERDGCSSGFVTGMRIYVTPDHRIGGFQATCSGGQTLFMCGDKVDDKELMEVSYPRSNAPKLKDGFKMSVYAGDIVDGLVFDDLVIGSASGNKSTVMAPGNVITGFDAHCGPEGVRALRINYATLTSTTKSFY